MKEFGVYRGWWVVAALFIAGMMVYGAGLYGFSLMIVPLSTEFGWSRAATGGLVSVFWLTAPLTLLGGYAVSKIGSVRLICLGIVLEAACLAFVSLTSSLALMYVLRALMGLGKIMVMIGVVAEASAWFRLRFGLALSVCYAGWHFGGLVLAPLTAELIRVIGWRDACVALAGLMVILSLPPLLLVRRWRPDTDVERGECPGQDVAVSTDSGPTSRSSLATMDFWLVITMTVFVCLTYGSLVTHEVAMIAGFGMGDTAAAAALSVTAGAALIGAIGAGQLIDRFGFRPSISLGLGLLILGIAGFLLLVKYPSQQLMLASAATSGFAIGGFDTCFVAYLKRRFGGAELNRLFGIWYFFALATLLLGPIFTGWLFDVAGTYSPALLAMLISLVAAATLVVWVRPEPRLIAPATLPAH